jgi:hypothetical protein
MYNNGFLSLNKWFFLIPKRTDGFMEHNKVVQPAIKIILPRSNNDKQKELS